MKDVLQPVVFIGHGSPLNVVSENDWTRAIKAYGQRHFAQNPPKAIVLISAHWLTRGTKIHKSKNPKTLHDFGGFPDALYEIQYPTPDNSNWADQVFETLNSFSSEQSNIELTSEWGLDHGAWGVLRFLRPQGDLPIIPVSLNRNFSLKEFFELGKSLGELRTQGVLIVASGNLVHNLREIDFENEDSAHSWAVEFDQSFKTLVEAEDVERLMNWPLRDPKGFQRAHPSPDHWLPWIVALGAAGGLSKIEWIFQGLQNGSISMRSLEMKT